MVGRSPRHFHMGYIKADNAKLNILAKIVFSYPRVRSMATALRLTKSP